MKQWFVSGCALALSLVAAQPVNVSASPSAAAVDVSLITEVVAWSPELPLDAPMLASSKKELLSHKCFFNGSRNLFRLRRTECRMA